MPSDPKPGDSSVQKEAHEYIRKELAAIFGLNERRLSDTRIDVKDSFMVFTALSKDLRIVCEASAHIGKTKTAQIHKVMNNAMKMLFLEQLEGISYRKILVFIDEEAASKFVGKGWHGECLRKNNIEVMVVDVPERIKEKVKGTQKDQYR